MMNISFSNSDNPSMIFSLLTPGGHEESGFTDVISVTVVDGIISDGSIIEVLVVAIAVVEVVEVVEVSGMKSVWIFIFSYFNSFDLIRPRGSIMKVPESRVSSKKSSVEPT